MATTKEQPKKIENKANTIGDDIFSRSTAMPVTALAIVFVVFAMTGWANESYFSTLRLVVSLSSVYYLSLGIYFKKWNSLWAPAVLLYLFNPIIAGYSGSDWIIFYIFALITFSFTYSYFFLGDV